MFNDCNPATNGEQKFFNFIKDKINVIFDVGSRTHSEFLLFEGEVHYFDPVKFFVDILKTQHCINKKAYYNNFGLGDQNKELYYYPKFESFYNRVSSCKVDDSQNKILLSIKKAKDYVVEKNLQNIDFLKIDTEGYEFAVLKGFENCLDNIKIIQFEYGGTFIDNGVKLIDVIDYLKEKGFYKFSYLTNNGPVLITDFTDHYQYCNIVCINKNSDIVF